MSEGEIGQIESSLWLKWADSSGTASLLLPVADAVDVSVLRSPPSKLSDDRGVLMDSHDTVLEQGGDKARTARRCMYPFVAAGWLSCGQHRISGLMT